MTTTVEFPEDKVYKKCKTMLRLDHDGNIPITFFDGKTGDDLVMVYLTKEEILKIVNLYIENQDLIENEGRKKEEESEDEHTVEAENNGQPVQPIQPSP